MFSLVVNLSVLGFFKYYNFFLINFKNVLDTVGISFQAAELDLFLPIGISYYTFQTLSYTIDVYRRTIKPSKSFLDFALYVTFFPQLVAGPIVRASHFLGQCKSERRATGEQFGMGLVLLAFGLFLKVVLADHLLSPIVDKVYVDSVASFSDAWIGTFAFSGQIFCDFAGYSTCAVGVGQCLGFRLPENFSSPYASIGFSDFWKRWHISLSTWLRDYLYIPLGGNRRGTLRSYAYLSITMLLGGLWHGAGWGFIIWGALHGVYLIMEKCCRRKLSHYQVFRYSMTKYLLMAATFILICFTWVFFRADTIESALSIARSMFVGTTTLMSLDHGEVGITVVVVGAILWAHLATRYTRIATIVVRLPSWCQAMMLASFMFMMFISRGEGRAFIYFQF